ncbi:MAG: imidazole glycerol phosphate synthase subunit HisH [Gammaproteobacteria bacterium]|nr:imidazole glycerol phosphate synthase subunit HisH [Gammaproteobacteria bacterium]
MTEITVIDTGISNIASVRNAFTRIGCRVITTNSPDKVLGANILVLPGVGAYEQGMNSLRKYALVEPIKQRVMKENIPILGICLGMQLLAEKSHEHGLHAGLGIVEGTVVGLKTNSADFRVPNIGWYDVISNKPCVMFKENDRSTIFYHVHSYYLECTDPDDVAAHIEFSGKRVTVAIERDNVFGMQFHPEKSQDDGLNLLSRIVDSMSN